MALSRQFGTYLVSVHNGQTGEVITDLLHVGRGPGEAINAYYLEVSEDSRRFWSNDMWLNAINVFNVASILNGDIMPSERIVLDNVTGAEMSYVLTDSCIYSCPMTSDGSGRFSQYGLDGSLERLFGDFPSLRTARNVARHALPEIFYTNFCADYANNRFITADGFMSLIIHIRF